MIKKQILFCALCLCHSSFSAEWPHAQDTKTAACFQQSQSFSPPKSLTITGTIKTGSLVVQKSQNPSSELS